MENKTKILILCTGNSCRSQMAHGFLQSFDEKKLEVYSAGTEPAKKVNEKAVKVMKEVCIDISNHRPKNVNLYLTQDWDFVITVCDHAQEVCPVFPGKVKHRLHIGFEDPSEASGSEMFVIKEFRRVRDEIRNRFYDFYVRELKG